MESRNYAVELRNFVKELFDSGIIIGAKGSNLTNHPVKSVFVRCSATVTY
jgi:hypothetical protein